MPHRQIFFRVSSVGRLLFASLLFYPPIASVLSPMSLSGQASFVAALSAYPVYAILFVCGFCVVIDTIVNIDAPAVRFPRLDRARKWIYIVSAFAVLTIPYTVARHYPIPAASLYLYIVIFVSALVYACAASRGSKCQSKRY